MEVSFGMLVRCGFAVLEPVISSLLIAPDYGIDINANLLRMLVLKGRELGFVAMMTRMGVLQ